MRRAPLSPILLPGGRWILSAALSDDGWTTHLFCWDTQLSTNGTLKPLAHLAIEGLGISELRGSWAQVQFDHITENVIIAVSSSTSFQAGLHTYSRSFQVIRLSWDENPSAKPTLSNVALLLNHDVYMPTRSGGSNYLLQGDYITIDSSMDILVWNWKEDTLGAIDPDGHQWASGDGFLVCARPPFLYVIPHDLGEILAIQIPKLRPQGTSYLPLRSPLTVANALSDRRLREFGWSSVDIFDRWQPPALRHGLVTLITRTGAGEMHRIVQLPPTEQPTASPTSAVQDPHHFHRIPLEPFRVINDGKHGIVMEMDQRTVDPDVSIRAFPFDAREHNFSAPISQSIPVSDLGGDVWTRAEIGSFCLASGTALLNGSSNAVTILYFDWRMQLCEPELLRWNCHFVSYESYSRHIHPREAERSSSIREFQHITYTTLYMLRLWDRIQVKD